MPCETCNHPTRDIGPHQGRSISWCPRCGSLRVEVGKYGVVGHHSETEAPMLVKRVRKAYEDNPRASVRVPGLACVGFSYWVAILQAIGIGSHPPKTTKAIEDAKLPKEGP